MQPNGGVRGTVAGRRTHSRHLKLWSRPLPLSTGGECIAHSLQALTDLDPRAIDGIGAFDPVSRGAMLVVHVRPVENPKGGHYIVFATPIVFGSVPTSI